MNSNFGEKFTKLCNTFVFLEPIYTRVIYPHQINNLPGINPGEPYLHTHLRHWVNSYIVGGVHNTRTNQQHAVMTHTPGSKDDRRTLPSNILKCYREHVLPIIDDSTSPFYDILLLEENLSKVEVAWVVCYLNNILPDQNLAGWRTFECSHRCIERNHANVPISSIGLACVDPQCLTWESKPENQSRGGDNPICMRICNHCQQRLCVCQGIHNPPCI